MRSAILVLLCFLIVPFTGAQTLVLTNNTESCDVSGYIRYSIDLTGNKLIEDIRSDTTSWQTFKDRQTPNLGVNKQPYWFTFTLQNNSDKSDWIIHVDYQTLDDVSLFVYDTAEKLQLSDVQGILAKNKQKQRMPNFTLSLSRNEPVKVYVRVQTSSLLIFPVRISTPMAFSKIENAKRNVSLPAWGILIAALLFNLVLLSTSREKAYLFLSLSIAAEICFTGIVSGLLYENIAFDPLILLQKLRFVMLGLAYGFHAIFVMYYLNLKNHKLLFRLETGAILYFFIYSLLAGTGILSAYASGVMLVPTNILFLVIQFLIAATITLKKVPTARYYLFSFTPIFLAMLLYIAVYNSWIEVSLFFSNSGLYASAMFTILLTSGLTEKMIKVKHEKARANQLEIDKIELEAEITQRITVEKKLQESEIRFHNLFELSPLPVLVTEYESGKIVDTNLAIFNLTGFTKKELLGKTTYEMGFINDTLRAELFGLLSRNEQVLAYETILNIKGKPRTAHLFMSLLIIGQEKFIITLISDITKQKETEQSLKELSLTKDKFFSIIAHDLVNPFHAIILYSKELQVFTDGNERAASYNTNLLLTAQNTYNLLQNLLTWSRTQTRQISFNPQQINLGDIIAENVSSALLIAKSKQIEIRNEAKAEILIEADLQMINLILRNLISNSIKFSFNQGLIKIQSKEMDSQVSISVIDNGTGMEPREIEKLFDLFQTDQRPGTSGEAGTGLGLVICNEFVNYHHGSIQVESEPGKGSIFTITLPKKQ
jgi:PAS domain S-box-containing protein